MLHVPFRRFSWVMATLMVVALPGARSAFAAANPVATKMLSAQLPAGVPMSKATFAQTATALHDAVAKNPKMATQLIEAALMSKSSKYTMDCGKTKSLVSDAISASPGQARQITEAAMSTMPECASELGDNLGAGRPAGGLLGSVGDIATAEAEGFGAGLGGGFPGAPGFIGSAPSGTFAFPPVVVGSLTPTGNQ